MRHKTSMISPLQIQKAGISYCTAVQASGGRGGRRTFKGVHATVARHRKFRTNSNKHQNTNTPYSTPCVVCAGTRSRSCSCSSVAREESVKYEWTGAFRHGCQRALLVLTVVSTPLPLRFSTRFFFPLFAILTRPGFFLFGPFRVLVLFCSGTRRLVSRSCTADRNMSIPGRSKRSVLAAPSVLLRTWIFFFFFLFPLLFLSPAPLAPFLHYD